MWHMAQPCRKRIRINIAVLTWAVAVASGLVLISISHQYYRVSVPVVPGLFTKRYIFWNSIVCSRIELHKAIFNIYEIMILELLGAGYLLNQIPKNTEKEEFCVIMTILISVYPPPSQNHKKNVLKGVLLLPLRRKQYRQRSQIIPFKLWLIWCVKPWNTLRIISIIVAWCLMLFYFSILSHLFLSRFTD